MPSTVTHKGQVTIPKAIRAKLGIAPGNVVTFEVQPDGRVLLQKMGARPAESRQADLNGGANGR